MTREEIHFKFGYAGECMMCKIAIGAQDPRVAVYEQAEGKKREYIGLLCPTCAKIGKEEKEKPVTVKPDIEELLDTYDAGVRYAAKKKIKVSEEDIADMAISIYIQSRR